MATLSHRGIDDELMQVLKDAQEGDEQAWDRLFREFYPKVRRVVRRKLDRSMRSVYDSTDFASDVMKSLAANLSRLDFPTADHLVAFLATVAEQKVIDEHRRRHTLKRDVRRERRIDDPAGGASFQFASDGPTASQLAQAREVEDMLLDRRDEEERRVIELRLEGEDNSDIADRVGWNIRKVQRFFQGLQRSFQLERR